MVRLIISVVIIVVLAVLLAFNAVFVTPISLFGYRIENVPTVAVAIAGFVLGVLYSLVLYLMRFLAKRRSTTIRSKDRDVRLREQEVKEKEKRLEDLAGGMAEAEGGPATGGGETELPEGGPRPRRWGRKKK
jgi:membrane protein implicated in regulation of membrane protease activity